MWTSAILLAGCAEAAWAQAKVLTVSGSPTPFTVSTAIAGSQPAPISNSGTTYFVKVKKSAGAQRIAAQLNTPMPIGTTVTIQMAPPAGATGLGPVALDMTPRDIVVNIGRNNGSNQAITYVLTATVAAGVVPSQTRIVTLTMSSYP
jgi:broad specificity polyphosphatase/5'/3'-nucleotidase SurE